MDGLFLAFFLIIVAGFFGGSWGIGMKYMKPLSFGAWWLVFSIIGFVLFPTAWAWVDTPDLWGSLAEVAPRVLIITMLLGLLWGPAMFLFGNAINLVGISITFGIVNGLSALIGSIVPLFLSGEPVDSQVLLFLILGDVVMIFGIVAIAYASVVRERIYAKDSDDKVDPGKNRNVKVGILLCVLVGLLGSLMNIGFSYGKPIADAAGSPMPVWIVLFGGAFFANAAYAIVITSRSKSWDSFKGPGLPKTLVWLLFSSIAFFAGAGVYGLAANRIGDIGTSIGFPMYMSFVIIFSNLVGLVTGEWKGAMKAFRFVIAGVVIFIMANFILGYTNSLN